ncbi:MAG TPA: hypothetical protein ENJ82_16520, partial [Bacteroidetes bacterium]|nr:hypothetical protein [Bacteroidota bacterium]
MALRTIILNIILVLFISSCSNPKTHEGGGKKNISLPFQIDGIEAPKGEKIDKKRAALTSLKSPELLGSFMQDGFEILLLIGEDQNEQNAIHAISLKGKKMDEVLLCTYFDMEPAGTDVIVKGREFELRDFVYTKAEDRSYS